VSGETSATRFKIDNMTSTVIHTEKFIMPEGFNYAFSEINSDSEVEELNLGGNRRISPLILMEDLTKTAADLTNVELNQYLPVSDVANFDVITSNSLRVTPTLSSGTGTLICGPDLVTSTNVSPDDNAHDNKWRTAPWLIYLAAEEKSEPVHLRLPVSGIPAGTRCLVKTLALANAKKTAHFDYMLGGDSTWQTASFPASAAAQAVDGTLGYAISGPDYVEVTVRAYPGEATGLVTFDVYPQVATVLTPLFHIPDAWIGKSVSVSAGDSATGKDGWNKVILEARSLEWGTDSIWHEQEWRDLTAAGASSALKTPYLQFRFTGSPDKDGQPYLRSLKLTIH
jgi:hypothetical protein